MGTFAASELLGDAAVSCVSRGHDSLPGQLGTRQLTGLAGDVPVGRAAWGHGTRLLSPILVPVLRPRVPCSLARPHVAGRQLCPSIPGRP